MHNQFDSFEEVKKVEKCIIKVRWIEIVKKDILYIYIKGDLGKVCIMTLQQLSSVIKVKTIVIYPHKKFVMICLLN